MLLSALGDHGRVIAVDASAAMLVAAQSVIHDERVRWLHLPAERLAEGPVAGADAVVCNSAIWQTDVRATAAAVRRVLHPGGRFVFNLGAPMLSIPVFTTRLFGRLPYEHRMAVLRQAYQHLAADMPIP